MEKEERHYKFDRYMATLYLLLLILVGLTFLFTFWGSRSQVYPTNLFAGKMVFSSPKNILEIFTPQFVFSFLALFANMPTLQYWMFYHAFMPIFLRRKAQKRQGTVIDAHIKKPMGGIIVTLSGLTHNGKAVNKKQITSKNGRYSFFEDSGIYKINVDNPGYDVQVELGSSDASLKMSKGLIELYESSIIAPDIVLIPSISSSLKVSQKIDSLIILKFAVLLIGLAAAVIIRLMIPDIINTVIVLYYIILLVALVWTLKPFASLGDVRDKISKSPIKGAVVAIYNAYTNDQVTTQLTNGDGQYSFVLESGQYNMLVAKNGYEPLRSNSFTISPTSPTPALKVLLSKRK